MIKSLRIIEITQIIIVILIAISFYYMVYRIDKKHCENNGGVYIWEWANEGNKCHYKGKK